MIRAVLDQLLTGVFEMKTSDIRVGGIYTAKVSNSVVEMEVLSINKRKGNTYRKGGTTYTCKNLKTSREVLIKSAAKFRGEVKPLTEEQKTHNAQVVKDWEKEHEAIRARAVGTYSCCVRPVGSPHADDCPLFPKEGKKGKESHEDILEALCADRPFGDTIKLEDEKSPDPSPTNVTPVMDQVCPVVSPVISVPSVAQAMKPRKTPGQIIAERNSLRSEGEKCPHPLSTQNDLMNTSSTPTVPSVSSVAPAPTHIMSQSSGNPAVGAGSGLAARLQTPHVSHGRGGKHLIVIARAGTGKTFTLTKGLANTFGIAQPDVIPSDQQRAVWDAMNESKGRIRNSATAMVCFNNGIAAELKNKVPQGCKAMTNHTMGSLSIRRNFKLAGGDDGSGVYDARVLDIICELFRKDRKEMAQQYPGLSGILKELVGLCKQNLVGFDFRSKQWTPSTNSDYWTAEIFDLCNHYGVDLSNEDMDGSNFHDFTDLVLQWVPKILERCKDVGQDSQIDFNDMIWLPVVLNLPIFMNDMLLVDEAQDLNPCQQALVQRAGKRLILCGDPKQAIYGFAGADVDSLPTMEKILGNSSLGVQTLPLNVTRRCGRAIVKEAQQIVPDFFAHESNPEGVVRHGKYDPPAVPGEDKPRSYHSSVQQGDMLLCRVNAPLVSQCFKFLKEGRAANIQGRNIGKGIVDLINKLACDTVPELITKIDEWSYYETQKENARRDPNEARLIAITDKAECLRSFTDGSKEIADVVKKIQSIFVNASDENEKGAPAVKREECINLSSIHKAKGLEAQRVFLLEPEGAKVPHPMAKSAWQKEQELNLRYVAITRAIQELVYVS